MHRTWAIFVFGFINYLFFIVMKYSNGNDMIKLSSSFLLFTAIIQIVLGIFSIWSIRDILITTLHVGNGSLVLATSFYLTVWSWRLKK